MTRKTIYSRPLTPAQTQSIPLRQAPVNSSRQYHDYDHVESLYSARREKRQLSTESQRYPIDDKPGIIRSPGLHRVHHLDIFTGGSDSTPDEFPPNYDLTPSRSTVPVSPPGVFEDSARKRARTETNPEHSFVFVDGSRGNKCDLADLLNPSAEDTAIYSPISHDEEIDTLQPLVYVFSGSSQDLASPTSTGASDFGTSRSSSFATIRPRPTGHYGMLATDEDGQQISMDGKVKKKGRKKPFESDQRRAEVLEVREIGACLRCHIMRIGVSFGYHQI